MALFSSEKGLTNQMLCEIMKNEIGRSLSIKRSLLFAESHNKYLIFTLSVWTKKASIFEKSEQVHLVS